jgi:hypothetical protein
VLRGQVVLTDTMAARAAILALINTLPRLYRTTRRIAVEGRWRAFSGRSPLGSRQTPEGIRRRAPGGVGEAHQR